MPGKSAPGGWAILLAGIATVFMIAVMVKSGAPLKTSVTPAGILHLEFAYTADQVQHVLAAWPSGQNSFLINPARLNTWLDFAFILSYAILLYQLCLWIAFNHPKLYVIGKWMATSSLAAAALDVLENVGMLWSISGSISETNSIFTFTCAAMKWLIVIFVLVFILVGTIAILVKKRISRHRPS